MKDISGGAGRQWWGKAGALAVDKPGDGAYRVPALITPTGVLRAGEAAGERGSGGLAVYGHFLTGPIKSLDSRITSELLYARTHTREFET